MANAYFFSPDGGITRHLLEDTEARSRIAGQQSLLKDTVGWTGKNLCNIKKGRLDTAVHQYPFVLNGITFNMLEDGTLSVTGTSTSLTFLPFNLISKGFTVGQKLKLSGVTSGDYENKCSLSIRYNSDNIVVGASNTQGETLITLTQEAINADDLHVTLRIPNNATVNEIVSPMVRKADITDPTYEPYHESVESMFEDVADDIDGINLLDINIADLKSITSNGGTWNNNVYTHNGVTFTFNSEDNSIIINGTATAETDFYILKGPSGTSRPISELQSGMLLSGIEGDNDFCLKIVYRNASDGYLSYRKLTSGELAIEIPSNAFGYRICITVANGKTVTNAVVKPMLTEAKYAGIPYRPYNQQSIQHQINAQTGILGAKNFVDHNLNTFTANGITFTVNSNKSITVSGKQNANANTFATLMNGVKIPEGDYILTGCPKGGSATTYKQMLAIYDNSNTTYLRSYIDIGDGAEIHINEGETIRFYSPHLSSDNNGNTVSGTFYPMIRVASDPDDTYVPRAMTNRELTEKAGVWTSPVSCLTGDTTATISNAAIHATSTINPYIQTSSGATVSYSNLAVTEGQAVITFGSALTEAASVKLQILNV